MATKVELESALDNALSALDVAISLEYLPPAILDLLIAQREEAAGVLGGKGETLGDLDKLVELYHAARRWAAAGKRRCWHCDEDVATAACTCLEDMRELNAAEEELLECLDRLNVEVKTLGER